MRPTDKDFRELRKVDDKETHERIWQPARDPELPLAGQLEILALPETSLLYFLVVLFVAAVITAFYGAAFRSPVAVLGIIVVLAGLYVIPRVPYEFTYRFTDSKGAISEVVLNGRAKQATHHSGAGCFARVGEWVCEARTSNNLLLARSIMLGGSSSPWSRMFPQVGDTFDIYLPTETTPEEAKKLMECVTFGRFQRIAADSTD